MLWKGNKSICLCSVIFWQQCDGRHLNFFTKETQTRCSYLGKFRWDWWLYDTRRLKHKKHKKTHKIYRQRISYFHIKPQTALFKTYLCTTSTVSVLTVRVLNPEMPKNKGNTIVDIGMTIQYILGFGMACLLKSSYFSSDCMMISISCVYINKS